MICNAGICIELPHNSQCSTLEQILSLFPCSQPTHKHPLRAKKTKELSNPHQRIICKLLPFHQPQLAVCQSLGSIMPFLWDWNKVNFKIAQFSFKNVNQRTCLQAPSLNALQDLFKIFCDFSKFLRLSAPLWNELEIVIFFYLRWYGYFHDSHFPSICLFEGQRNGNYLGQHGSVSLLVPGRSANSRLLRLLNSFYWLT